LAFFSTPLVFLIFGKNVFFHFRKKAKFQLAEIWQIKFGFLAFFDQFNFYVGMADLDLADFSTLADIWIQNYKFLLQTLH